MFNHPMHYPPSTHKSTPPYKAVVVGKVLTTHGIHGHLKVQSMMQNPKDLGKLSPFCIHEQSFIQWSTFKPTGKPGIFLASGPHILTIDQAIPFRHACIMIDRAQLPHVDGEIYYSDLENKQVMDCDAVPMGYVIHVHDFGAGPVLELSESGLMISFYAIIDPDADRLHLKYPLQSFL